jgi:CRISP-associated protein Cas1
MQIYLNSYGAYLSQREGRFRVRVSSGEEHFFALRQTGAILLTRGTACSADALLLAAENDIPVLLIDAQTHFPLAQLSSGRPGSIAGIRKNQAAFARSRQGFEWVAGRLAAKISAQAALLERLCHAPGASATLRADWPATRRALEALRQSLADWPQKQAAQGWDAGAREKTAALFRGQEGTASRLYFIRLGQYLEGVVDFRGRQQHPAYDPFNALLNYLYGMLYTQVHLSMLKSGLDPFMGVLHADRYGAAPTLVFDAIEPLRPWADEVAVQLFTQGRVRDSDFEVRPDTEGYWLGAHNKDAAVEAMLQFMQEKSGYKGRQVRRDVQTDLEMQALATHLKALEEA